MNERVPVGVGTRFLYDGELLTVIEMFPSARGNEILVEDRCGQRRYWVSLRELLASGRAKILGDTSDPSTDPDQDCASVILSELDEAGRSALAERAGHIREVLTGYKSGSADLALPGEPRQEYLPARRLGDKYTAKATELGVDKRTVQRWASAYTEYGEAGLAPKRRTDPYGEADKRWVEAAKQIMIEHNSVSKPSKLSVIRQTNARVAAVHGAEVVRIPSRPTAYRILETLERQIPTFRLAMKRNREIATRPKKAQGALRPTRPGEFLVMDTTRLDVFALDPVTLKWVNAELTVAMDWYTRCIVGLRLTPVSTKAIDVAAVLYQSFRPRRAPAHWSPAAVWPEHGLPRAAFVDINGLTGEMKFGLSNPVVVPETLVIDHGKSFKSQHVTSICQRMGISIQPARLRTGRDKGIIERFFRTLREDLLQLLPGYKGPDIYSRGADPEGESFFYLDQLEDMIRQWVAEVYHLRPHSSLIDPRVPGLRMSPAEMFVHGVERAGFIEAPRDPDLAFEFLQPEKRIISDQGVQIDGRFYNGDALNLYRNTESEYVGAARRKWYIHIDPDDITRVYFRDPADGTWHALRWTKAPDLDIPLSEDSMHYARKLAIAQGRSDDPETALSVLLEHWKIGLGDSPLDRRIALRMSRERAALTGDLVTEEDPRNLAKSLPSGAATTSPPTYESFDLVEDGDDLDDVLDHTRPDAGRDPEDDYYADAFEDQ